MLDPLLFAQQTLPRMDGMYWLMLASRIFHILAAIVLVGGLFYLRTVVTASRLTPGEGLAEGSTAAHPDDHLFGGRRANWAMWVGIASLLLLATGLFNFLQIVRMHERMGPVYHSLAGLKILGGIALFILAAVLAGSSPAAQSLRRNWRMWLSVCVVLGILTAVMGSFMRSFDHVRKVDAPVGPAEFAP